MQSNFIMAKHYEFKRPIKLSLLFGLLLVLIALTGCSRISKTPADPLQIGVLIMSESREAKLDGLRQGLSELGLTEPQVNFTVWNAYDNAEKLENDAQELIEQKPDILVAAGVIEAETLARSLQGKPPIPVVMIGVTSPTQLQDQFAKQGVPITGVDNGHVDLTAKRLELLRLLFPERNRLLVIYDPRISASTAALSLAQTVKNTDKLNYVIEPVPVGGDSDLEQLKKRRFTAQEAMLILPSYYLESKFRTISVLSLARHIPVMGLYDSEVEAGYTASYGISYFDQGYQAARLVTRMAKEKRTLPFELPDSVSLKLNMEAVKRIGERVSPEGLSFAEKIYAIKE